MALASAKGSPGVTTLGLALASAWPRPALLAELDPAGGDLAPRLRRPFEPGLLTLAAAARHGLAPELVLAHAQPLTDDARLLLAPPSGDQAHAALGPLAGRLGEVLRRLPDGDVLADCGRLDAASPALEVARRADVVLLVTRPTLEGVQLLAARRAALEGAWARVGVVVVGERDYPPEAVAAAVGAPLMGVVPERKREAKVLWAQGASRSVRLTLLWRSARGLADALATTPKEEVAV